MNSQPIIKHHPSVCPHDCPSACALDVEVIDGHTIGRIRGAKDQTYTAGVICAKVARYAERQMHPDRLLYPLRRTGPKGSGQFERIGWDEALDIIASRFSALEAEFGPESIWPYHYAGTMGRVMRDGIMRLTHAKKYSRFLSTICINMAWPGFIAGTGSLRGPDPREMAKADCVVIWGTNAVATQVNVMTHAMRARKERGAKIVVIDIYNNATMQQADMALCLRPGTDGALAAATMHVLLRDKLADRAWMQAHTDVPDELEAHLATRTPEWAASITGLSVAEIEAFAHLVGRTKKTYLRLGYGFSRQRNGAASMHAALCIASVTGAWAHEGGGAFHNNAAIYHWSASILNGTDVRDMSVRALDQSRIGAILAGDLEALCGGSPVKALLVQSTNPMSVAPDQSLVRRGFEREDLFVVVHEQFITETARMADIVLPATMFLEHDDVYSGGGHQHVELGLKLVPPPGECRSNHEVICAIAQRVGAQHKGFSMSAKELIDATLRESGHGTLAELESRNWLDVQPDFATSHFLDGFVWPDKKFRFKADWPNVPFSSAEGPKGPWQDMPALPDYWPVNEPRDEKHPFKLATSPAHSFLNSTFNETKSSQKREGRPHVLVNPDDASRLGLVDGDSVSIGNRRGSVFLHVHVSDDVRPGMLVSEGLWPNSSFRDGQGINVLTSAESVAPFGGAAFHDVAVWLKKA